MSIYNLKKNFQNLLRPIVIWLATQGVTANQVTVAAVLLSFVWGGFIYLFWQAEWPLIGLSLLLFFRMALNAIDGMLAREHNQQSSLGAILNELGDVVADTALYLPFMFIDGISMGLVISIVILSILSEMAGVVSVQIGASRRYDGPMGKSDRAFAFGLLGLCIGFELFSVIMYNLLLFFVMLLLCYTIYKRCYNSLRELDNAKP